MSLKYKEHKHKDNKTLSKPYEELSEEEKECTVHIVEKKRGGFAAMR